MCGTPLSDLWMEKKEAQEGSDLPAVGPWWSGQESDMNFDFVFLAPDPNPGFYFTPPLPSQRVLTLGSPLPAPPHPSARPLVAPRLVPRPLDYSEPLQFFQETHEITPFVLPQHTAQSQGDPRLPETMNTGISESLGQR